MSCLLTDAASEVVKVDSLTGPNSRLQLSKSPSHLLLPHVSLSWAASLMQRGTLRVFGRFPERAVLLVHPPSRDRKQNADASEAICYPILFLFISELYFANLQTQFKYTVTETGTNLLTIISLGSGLV